MAELSASALSMRLRVLALLALLGSSAVLAVMLSVAWPRSLFVATLVLLPLLLPLPGIVRAHRRTYAWATLCVTPYFIYGFTELVANPGLRVVATAMLLASLGLVAVLVAYLRVTRPVAADHDP